ncbi:hypothetical protein ACTWP5_27635 [Streptomyces sp. 4N509B]|uniref:hypothetical protein n=1 Tax=Streptomyces sp. 4N509B TaxID=3457413 RepID=UPI003FCFB9F3
MNPTPADIPRWRPGDEASPFRVFLDGGPADQVREYRPDWVVMPIAGGVLHRPVDPPDRLWLCRLLWPLADWRVHTEPFPGHRIMHGRTAAALYWLERERDNSPKTTPDGRYIYAHVPEDEVAEYLDGPQTSH